MRNRRASHFYDMHDWWDTMQDQVDRIFQEQLEKVTRQVVGQIPGHHAGNKALKDVAVAVAAIMLLDTDSCQEFSDMMDRILDEDLDTGKQYDWAEDRWRDEAADAAAKALDKAKSKL